MPVPDPCDLPGASGFAVCGAKEKVEDAVGSAVETATTVIEFGKDPFGFIAQKEAEAAKDLTENVIPALTQLTQPDLGSGWFLETYAISFAAAIFGWVLISLWDLATFRRRGESGQEVVDSWVKWAPIFIGGSMFGPAVGAFLVRGIGHLNAALVNWGLSATATEVVTELNKYVTEDPGKFLGGAFVAMIVLGALVFALLLVFLVLVIMLVTLYFSGAVLPLSLMWATKIGQREKGRKIIMVWAGILCSQPLIFLLLGFAFSGATSQLMDILEDGTSTPGSNISLANMVQLLVIIVMLVIATLGPTSLARYAPIGPTDGAPGGPGVNARGAGKSSGARGGAGPSSSSSSQTSQVAQQNAAKQSSSMGSGMGAGAGSSGTAAAGTAAGAAATGGTLLAAQAAMEGGKGLANMADQAKEKGQESAQGAQEDSSGQDGGTGASGAGQAGPSGTSGAGDTQAGLAAQTGGGGGAGDSGSGLTGGGQDNGGSQSGGKGESQGGGLGGAGQKAAQLGGRAVSLAQQAGDFAEEQMDHHREEPRGRR